MTIDELNFEYIDFCNKFNDCKDCKYDENSPCQLMFGYDKGRADAIDECIKIVELHENEYDGICWACRELKELKEQKNDERRSNKRTSNND